MRPVNMHTVKDLGTVLQSDTFAPGTLFNFYTHSDRVAKVALFLIVSVNMATVEPFEVSS